MSDYQAIPGAQCPIPAINLLLKPDERFLINQESYALQPKTIACLKELLSILNEESITYRFMQKNRQFEKNEWILSLQNLTRIELLEESIVSVEAGCKAETLKNFLYENGMEIGLSSRIDRGSVNISELIFDELKNGLKIRQLSLQDRILAIESVKSRGELLKWGWPLEGARPAPMMHQLISEIKELTGSIVKCVFKAERVPAMRLFLKWPFENWKIFKELEEFTSTWERLDCLIPADKNEKGCILGQISGLKEEMEAFIVHCPGGYRVMKEDQVHSFKAYFKQQKASYRTCRAAPLIDFNEADYFWYHGLIKEGNLIYINQELEIETALEQPLWKERVINALFN